MEHWRVFPEETPSKHAVALAEQIERDGGHVLAIYREPVGTHWHIFGFMRCLLRRNDRSGAGPALSPRTADANQIPAGREPCPGGQVMLAC